VLFSKEDVDDALRALVDELVAAGVGATIDVVGGAAVSLQVGREALTGDIDAPYPVTPAFTDAARRVGAARNWPVTWLNDAVKMYVSHYDTASDWDIRIGGEGVVVRVGRAELLLAMKLNAGRGRRDAGDIDRLLDACGVTSLAAAQGVFDRHYPAEVIAEPALRQLLERFDRPDGGDGPGG